MNKLDELIALLCPNGVKYPELAHAVSIERGKRVVREQLDETGLYPVYQNSLTPLGYHSQWNYPAETTFLIVAGAAGEIGYSTCNFWAADDCFPLVCGENLSSRYLYHVMLWLQPTILSRVRKASIPRLSRDSIERLTIPLPPLEVQREIIRILDSFADLTSKLTESLSMELTARKQQYMYYRDILLNFDPGIKQVKLGDICSLITKGTTPKKFVNQGVSFVKTEAIDGSKIILDKLSYIDEETHTSILKRSILEENDILITIAGATIGKCLIVPPEILPANTNQALAIVRLAKGNSPRYILHLLQSGLMKKYIKENIKGSAQPNLTLKQLNDFVIPLPTLSVQQRLVEVLDNFDAICSDLNIGLPAEIEARKKQYEFYRDQLLTFAAQDEIVLTDRQTDEYNALIRLCQYVFGYVSIELGSIGKVSMCKRIMKAETAPNGDVPFYKIGTFGKTPDAYISREKFEEYRKAYSFPKKGDVLISAAGTIGRTVIYDGEDAYYQDSNIVWVDNDESIVLNRYLFYCYQLQPWAVSEGGTIARLYNDNISKAKIKVPSIAEQKRIIAILDHFSTLCTDLTSALPAEIEARKKQYEYYRDNLLSFTPAD